MCKLNRGTYTPPVREAVVESDSMQLTIIAVISTVLNLTNKGEHTGFYKINNNVYIYVKTSKIINYSHNTVFLSHSSHTHTQFYYF